MQNPLLDTKLFMKLFCAFLKDEEDEEVNELVDSMHQSTDNNTTINTTGSSTSSNHQHNTHGGGGGDGRSMGIKYPPDSMNSPVSPINISTSTDNDVIDISLNEEDSDND